MGSVYPQAFDNFVLPVYDIVRGTSKFRFGHALEKTQWCSREEIARLQNHNLRLLMKHAYQTVPYYRRIFKQRQLTPSDVLTSNGLSKLPILTKEDIRNNFKNLVSVGYDKNKLVRYQSGGSGDPIHFYITKESSSWEIAAEYRAYSWAGYRLGDRCFMFWGSPIDLARAGAVVKKFTRSLERILIADTCVLSEDVFVRLASALRKFRPKIIRGYASSVFMMAKYLNENHIDSVRPKAVITSAETLYDSMRKEIEEAFDCQVFDYYGSREIGGIAAECKEHLGYHISAENVVTEFVDDDGPVSAGEKGVLLLTSLKNFGMPFIRYKIGDIGIPSDEACSCGRGLPLMSSIEGRISDFMACYDQSQGRVVPVGPLYPVIISAAMHLPIENCQVVQENIDMLTIKIVKSKGYAKEHTDFLAKYVQKHLGYSIKIKVEFVDSIPPLPSGKRSVFLSRIDPFQLPPNTK